MLLYIIILLTEIFTPVVLRQRFFTLSRAKYITALIFNTIMSVWLWFLIIEIESDHGFYDSQRHIWLLLNLMGMTVAVVVPRIIIIISHFTGALIRIKTGGYIRWMTNSGLISGLILFLIIATATLHGRFNFKTENVTIGIKGLNSELDGLKIAQISDMHLAGFYHHKELLRKVVDTINFWKPDLIINTGDFVTYGWREYGRTDTILSKAVSRLGNWAVLGNHDHGTYHPYFTEAERENNVLNMNRLVKLSGYNVLTDEYTIINSGNARIGLIGISTVGRHPNIKHGDINKAMIGLDSVDLKILLSHDPNQWEEAVAGKTDIDLTLSGHTHGMQMGLYTKKFRWSPAKYFYPHWNGLFSERDQYHYVNRGLGVLKIPFRISMPPEITLITLKRI